MNKHILFVMRSLDNPELFTQEEKEGNKKSAAAADDAYVYIAAVYMAYGAFDAAAEAAAVAAANTAYAACDTDWAEYWVNKFFKRAGEDKQTYIDEVERLKGE